VSAQAETGICNPKIDITQNINTGNFIYSEACHIEFGKLRMIEKERQSQIDHLKQSLSLKDLALDFSNKRIENWQEATYRVEDRLLKMEQNSQKINWVYFGLGVIVMGGATWAAAQLR
jgi:succinylglutamate desuccinylase